MFHDVKHHDHCEGLAFDDPDLRECTCGVIIDCLLAERDYLRKQLDDLHDGTRVVLPHNREHAAALHVVAHAALVGTDRITPIK